MGQGPATRADGTCEASTSTYAGVTRSEVLCGPRTADTAVELARQWGQDRVIGSAAVDRLADVVLAAVANGLRFDPERVTLTLQWLDLDRIRVAAEWRGCSRAAPTRDSGYDARASLATLDALADHWGFESSRSGRMQWMVLDTRQ